MSDSSDRDSRPEGQDRGSSHSPRGRDGGKPPYERGSAGAPRGPREGGRSSGPRAAGGDRPARDGERKPWSKDGGGAAGRPQRDGERKPCSRDGRGAGGSARPSRDGERKPWSKDGGGASRPQRDGEGKPWSRDGGSGAPRPARDGERKPWSKDGGRDSGGRDAGRGGARPPRDGDKLWTRDGRPARNDRDAPRYEEALTEEQLRARELRSVRPRHEDPEIPEDVKPGDLDRIARNELKTLSKDNAEGVAQHLVMAARLIEEDPELAHRHATSAARRAGRIAVVRESLAITAYAVGDYALALRELRTYRRISGKDDQLALMVDSERGQGRPDKALELGRSVPKETLPAAEQVALAIAMSGARLDLGQTEAALDELSIAQLNRDVAYSYSADLFHAYAEVLEELGRSAEADAWRQRADAAEAAFADPDEGWDDMVEVVEEDLELEDAGNDSSEHDGPGDASAVGSDGAADDAVDSSGDPLVTDEPSPPSEESDSEEIAVDVDDELEVDGDAGDESPATDAEDEDPRADDAGEADRDVR
ncbi:hypothetical protein SAMN06265879_1902 [Clavibacter michiganensis]|nr:hypothetical protein SAMN06265879_1902 [Clavibacter michiganensis]